MLASADNATQKTIVLTSSDGTTFEVEEAVALKSETIKKILADSVADAPIPLPNVSSDILAKVIEYLKYHTEAAAKAAVDGAVAREVAAKTYVRDFDTEFLKVDQTTLFELIMAANFLDIKSLLDLTCQTVADMMKGKTPEEIRKAFNLAADDFSPEEEEEVRRMNAWAFE